MSIGRRRTAVVVPVPAAEPVVSRWRERFDPSAAAGMPAHITVLYPFLDAERLDDDVLAALRELCAERPALDVAFRQVGRFPGVLYLDPEPAEDLRRLTLAIAERWPEARPYGGSFEEVIPHLTVARGASDDAMADIESNVLRGLPLHTRVPEASLWVFDGTRWRRRARLAFSG
jgi:2'-5' RNA ligase